ncbi:MAG TPA: RNA-binding protein [Rhizomicrobium sp.]|jgi:hypothetical protein|nr:RNA-binding protein [Rhizomicrobium sp.]
MNLQTTLAEEAGSKVRERCCIVTRQVLPEERLVRYVLDPQGGLVPDLAARLPGRGMWVSANRATLERAIGKGHFSRAANAPVAVTKDIVNRVEKLLVARIAGDLGLARRAGQLILGFENVARALAGTSPPPVLIEASDGADDGRRKLVGMVKGAAPVIIDCLTRAELSLALGRENVVHAALKSGRLSERLAADAGRLRGFRCGPAA